MVRGDVVIGGLVSALVGEQKARGLHLFAVRKGLWPRSSLTPNNTSPKTKNEFIGFAKKSALMGRFNDASSILVWAIDSGNFNHSERATVADLLFKYSYLGSRYELCELAAGLVGLTAEEFVSKSKDFNLLAKIRPGKFHDQVRRNLNRRLINNDKSQSLLGALHNFSTDFNEVWPPGEPDPFWVMNRQLRISPNNLQKIRNSEPVSISNIRFNQEGFGSGLDELKVTVIIPAFNAQKTISYALDAVCNQSHRNLEIVVVNDQSEDETLRIAESVAKKDDRLVVLSTQDNGGAYHARNVGLQVATGDLVLVIDADDFPFPELVENHLKVLSSNKNLVGVVSKAVHVSPSMKILHTKSNNQSSLTFWREKVVGELGYWDESVRVSADTEFHERIIRVFGHNSVETIDKTLSFCVFVENSLTRNGELDFVKTMHNNGGFRTVYRDRFRRYHDRAENLYCRVGEGLQLMQDYMTSKDKRHMNSLPKWLVHFDELQDSLTFEQKYKSLENGPLLVADMGCLFAKKTQKGIQVLGLYPNLTLATSDFARDAGAIPIEKCRGWKLGGASLASICGCDSE